MMPGRELHVTYSLLHPNATSATVITGSEVLIEPPRAGRLHREVPEANATTTIPGQARHRRGAGWDRRYASRSNGGRSVKPPALSALGSSDEACLPSAVARLLVDVVTDGFVLHCCGPKAAPFALVASYQWEDFVDLITIRRVDQITTARVPAPRHGRIDLFAPTVVVWTYEGPPQCALRALLRLAHPRHPDAPASAYPAPPALRIPLAEQRPMTIRFPPPGRAGIRAARLLAAMAAPSRDPQLKCTTSA